MVFSYSTITISHGYYESIPVCTGPGGCGITTDNDYNFGFVIQTWAHLSTPLPPKHSSHFNWLGHAAGNASDWYEFHQRPVLYH